MRVGSLVFATDQGLGILAKDFYDNGIVTDVIVVRHGSHPNHPEWYPSSPMLESGRLNMPIVHKFIRDMDAMLFFETPFNWDLIDVCKQEGTPSILMPMHECTPKVLPRVPEYFFCPSKLECQRFVNGPFIPVPVEAKWRLRKRADVFVHNAGHGGLLGRNGTGDLYKALPLVKKETKLILRTQDPIEGRIRSEVFQIGNVTVDYRLGTFPYETLFEEGDAFVFPERFNGLSLPIQEAFASGMLVMATDRFPNNDYLPRDPLIRVRDFVRSRVSPRFAEFVEAIVNPQDIAIAMDKWNGKLITRYSELGKRFGQEQGWDAVKPLYMWYVKKIVKDYEKSRTSSS